jgi:hypothetical protein
MCKKYGGDFGRQKMFTMASMIIFPVIVGVLIDKISAYRGKSPSRNMELYNPPI